MVYFEKLDRNAKVVEGRWNSFIVTSFDDSLTVEKQMRAWIKKIQENVDLTNAMAEYLNEFSKNFDEKLYNTVTDVLTEWLNSGVLADLITEEVLADINNKLNNKLDKNGLIYPANLSQEVKEMIAGSTGIPVLGDDMVYTDSIQKDAVTRDKINFYSDNISLQLFDKTLLKAGGYFNENGVWIENANYNSYAFSAKQQVNHYFRINGGRPVAFWNGNTFISGLRLNTGDIARTVMTPLNTTRVTIAVATTEIDTVFINEGSTWIGEGTPLYNDEYLSIVDNNLSQLKNSVSMTSGTFITTTNTKSTPYYDVDTRSLILPKNISWYVLTSNSYYNITDQTTMTEDLVIPINKGNAYIFYHISTKTFSVETASFMSTHGYDNDLVYMGYVNTSLTYTNSDLFKKNDIETKEKIGKLLFSGYNNTAKYDLNYEEGYLTTKNTVIVCMYNGNYVFLNSGGTGGTEKTALFARDENNDIYTSQYLYMDINKLELFFTDSSGIKTQTTHGDSVYLGYLNVNLGINDLNIDVKPRAPYASASLYNTINNATPIVDYSNKTLTLPAQGANTWLIVTDTATTQYEFVSALNDNTDVVIPLNASTTYNYLFARIDRRPAEFRVITASEFMRIDLKNYYYLGFINVNSRRNFLRYGLDNDYLYNGLYTGGSGGSTEFNKTNNNVIYGDSLSTYAGDTIMNVGNNTYYPSNDVDVNTKTWWRPIVDKYCVNAKNMAWSGGRVTDTHPTYPSTIDLVNSTTVSFIPNILITMIGTNDMSNNATLTQFETAMNDLVTAQRTKFVNASIYLCGMPLSSRWFNNFVNANGNTYKEFNDIIKKVCEERKCVYVELGNVGIGVENYLNKFGDSGVHFNTAGMRVIRDNVIKNVAEFN